MRLEEEIKQKKFKDEYHKLAVNLQFTANWMKAIQSPLFKKYGI